MASRIRIKVGAIEVEYEGEEKFIKDELPALIKTVAVLHEKAGPALLPPGGDAGRQTGGVAGSGGLTTSQVATKLGSKSGSDLALAASAHLSLVKGKPQFTRAEIVKEMKSATSFFKKTFVSNLSNYLKTLVLADQLNEVGTETYALSETETSKLKGTLGL
jgi:hypothetical protein